MIRSLRTLLMTTLAMAACYAQTIEGGGVGTLPNTGGGYGDTRAVYPPPPTPETYLGGGTIQLEPKVRSLPPLSDPGLASGSGSTEPVPPPLPMPSPVGLVKGGGMGGGTGGGTIDGFPQKNGYVPYTNEAGGQSAGGAGSAGSASSNDPSGLQNYQKDNDDCNCCTGCDHGASKDDTSSCDGSYINFELLTYIHDAWDYQTRSPLDNGCRSCSGAVSCMPTQDPLHGLRLKRLHRPRNANSRSSLAPGVFLHLDAQITDFYPTIYDGASGRATVFLPGNMVNPATTLTGIQGVMTETKGIYRNLTLQKADGTPVTTIPEEAQAVFATLHQHNGMAYVFELVRIETSSVSLRRQGRLVRIEDRNGNAETIAYRYPRTATDVELNKKRSLLFQIQTVTDHYGRQATFTYGADGYVSRIDVPSGGALVYEREQNVLVKITHPDGAVSLFGTAYDASTSSVVLGFDDPVAGGTHRRKTVHVSASTWTDPLNPDPNKPVVSTTPNLVLMLKNGDNEVMYRVWSDTASTGYRYIYQGGHRLVRASWETADRYFFREMQAATDFFYGKDPASCAFQPEHIWTQDPNSHRHQVTSATDGLGRQVGHQTDAAVWRVNGKVYPDGSTSSKQFGPFNLPLVEIDQDGRITRNIYDERGNLIERIRAADTPGQTSERWTYNDRGQPLSFTDANGFTTDYVYTANGHLFQVIKPADTAGGARPTTQFSFDASGRLVRVVDARQIGTDFAYDNANRLTVTTFADGTTQQSVYGIEGDDAGLLIASKDRNNVWTTIDYDRTGREISRVEGAGTDGVRTTKMTYLEGTSLVRSRTVDGKTTGYIYDGSNRLQMQTVLVNGQTGLSTTTGYDEAGKPFITTDPYQRSTGRLYDSLGRVVREVQELVAGSLFILQDMHTRWQAAHPDWADGGPWQGTDVGQSGLPGSFSQAEDGTMTVQGNGAELYYEQDQFYFVHQRLVGDGEIVARLVSQDVTHPWAKSGVMIRADLTPGSPHAFVMVTPGYGSHVNSRPLADQYTDFRVLGDHRNLPVWLKLIRSGRQVMSFTSVDGQNWLARDRVSVNIGETCYIGLAVLAHVTDKRNQSVFDQVNITRLGRSTIENHARMMMSHLTRDLGANPGYAIRDFTYTPAGDLLTETDARGIQTVYTYDEHHRVASIARAVGTDDQSLVQFVYDAVGNRTQVISPRVVDGAPVITKTEYTPRNQPWRIWEAWGSPEQTLVAERTYTLTDKLETEKDARGNIITNIYHSCCDRLTDIIDQAGFQTSFTYDGNGNRLSVRDANGQTTGTTYDSRGRVKTITNAAGETTTWVYDNNLTDNQGAELDSAVASFLAGYPLVVNDAVGSAVTITNPMGEQTIEVFDSAGRPILRVDALHHTTSTVYDYCFEGLVETSRKDANGHVTTVRTDALGGARFLIDAQGQVAKRAFDAAGNVLSERDANLVGRDFAYDGLGRLKTMTETDGGQQTRFYDAAGNLVEHRDAKGVAEINTYDRRNRRLTQVDRVGGTTRFSYDTAGNLTHISDADNNAKVQSPAAYALGMTDYVYDQRNLLIAETFPTGQQGRTRRRYEYDPGRRLKLRLVGIADTGNLLGFTASPKVEATQYEYDLANRLQRRGYDDARNDAFAYDRAGRLITAQSGRYANLVSREYDAAGRLARESLAIAAGIPVFNKAVLPAVYTVGYGYDADGQLTSMTYPDGRVLTQTHTARHQLMSVAFPGIAVQREYDAAGRLERTAYGNLVTETRQYKPESNLVQRIQAGRVIDFEYRYDELNRKTAEVDHLHPQQTQHFDYDYASRLTSWERGNDERRRRPAETQTWNLSLVGDWNATTRDGVREQRSHTGVHEAVQVGTQALNYDFKGNLTRDEQGQLYAWDPENRLQGAAGLQATDRGNAAYAYDALGRRISKSVDGRTTHFAPSGARVVMEVDVPTVPTMAEALGDGTAEQLAREPQGVGAKGKGRSSGGIIPGPTSTQPGAGVVRINFQPVSTPTPDGFLSDKGRRFDVRTNGLSYGWNEDRVDDTRVREVVDLAQYDTLIHMRGARWEIALPDGEYPVAVVAGDAAYVNQSNHLLIENNFVRDPDPFGFDFGYRRGDFDGWLVMARIRDGRLTISQAFGAINAKLCFLEIGPKDGKITADMRRRLSDSVEAMSELSERGREPRVPSPKVFVYGSYVDEVLCYQQTVGGVVGVYYPHYNHLYSVAALTNAAGQVVERFTYDAYGKQKITDASGNVTRAKSAVGWDRGFTGFQVEGEVGLLYARARWYSPTLGRFVGRDPLRYNGDLLESGRPRMFWKRVLQVSLINTENPIPDGAYSDGEQLVVVRGNQITVYAGQLIRPSATQGDGYHDGFNLYMGYFAPNGLDPSGTLCCKIPGPLDLSVGAVEIKIPKDGYQIVKDKCECDALGGQIVALINCLTLVHGGGKVGGKKVDVGIDVGGTPKPVTPPNTPEPDPPPAGGSISVVITVTF